MKSIKTTIIGIASLVLLLISMLLVYLDKATLTEATAGLVSITAFTQFLLGLNSKDNNATHSKNNNCSKKHK